MPLIDLQTNLKDLKYGDFGTAEPLVTKDINSPPNRDGLAMEVGRRTDDLKRISKLLTTAPGLKHVANQTALNIVEKNIQSNKKGKSFFNKVLSGGWSSAKAIASTLAQVPVNGTGTHFVEGFAGKRGYLPKVQGHRSSLNGEIINTKIEGDERQTEKGPLLTKFDTEGTATANFSFVDAGNTTVEDAKRSRKERLEAAAKKLNPVAPEDLDKKYYSPGAGTGEEENRTKDLGLTYNTRADGLFTQVDLGFNRTNQAEFDSPGTENKEPYKVLPTDQITAKFPRRGKINVVDALDTKSVEEKTKETFKDLIDFNFKLIEPQSSMETMPDVTTIHFRAYLDSFSDSFNGEWSSFKYVGRAEDFYNYTGFNRSISFSFKVAASSIDEMKPLYNKLNLLAGSTAPTYTGKNYMRGTFTALTIGGYLINEPGIIESIALDWNTDYNWHTHTHGNESRNSKKIVDDVKDLPQILDVSVTFNPVHTSAPAFGNKFIGKKNRLTNNATELDEVVVTAKKKE